MMKKYGQRIVRSFSKTRPHSFFSESKFHFTCIITRHQSLNDREILSKNDVWRWSDSRALPKSCLAACNSRRNAIWLRKKITLRSLYYTCKTYHSRVRHTVGHRKRLLKNRATLSIHAHDEVDQVRNVK